MQRPSNVAETTQLLIEAGIAERMLRGSRQSHLPSSTEGCSFWVEVSRDLDAIKDGKEIWTESTSVIVQFPPEDHNMQAFQAMRGDAFGVYGQEPLEASQQDLVDRLAKAWKKEFPFPASGS